MNKLILKHIEEIGGIAFGLCQNLFDQHINFLQIDLMAIVVKVLSDVPGFFAAGFFGGLGGYAIRLMITLCTYLFTKKQNKSDEQNP